MSHHSRGKRESKRFADMQHIPITPWQIYLDALYLNVMSASVNAHIWWKACIFPDRLIKRSSSYQTCSSFACGPGRSLVNKLPSHLTPIQSLLIQMEQGSHRLNTKAWCWGVPRVCRTLISPGGWALCSGLQEELSLGTAVNAALLPRSLPNTLDAKVAPSSKDPLWQLLPYRLSAPTCKTKSPET